MDDLDSILADLSSEAQTQATPAAGAGAGGGGSGAGGGGGGDDLDALLDDLGVAAGTDGAGASPAPAPAAATTATAAPVASAGSSGPAPLSSETTAMLNAMDGEDRSAGNATCSGCNGQIFGGVLKAMDKFWHPEHFTCVRCSAQLKTDTFLIRANQPHCATCHDSLLDVCAKCSMNITDAPVKALGASWHAQCFKCSCGVVFADGDGSFIEHQGVAYCDECFGSSFGQRCAKCSGVITDSAIDAGGASYCKACFKCATCNVSISTTGSINFFEVDGNLYCSEHVPSGAVASVVCEACSQPIVGDAALAGDKSFHSSCLRCDDCAGELVGTRFFLRNDRRVCESCAGMA